MATYKKIQEYVNNLYGWRPETCWIANAKRKSGLPVRDAPNRKGEIPMNPCPPDKRKAIEEALQHFGIIK